MNEMTLKFNNHLVEVDETKRIIEKLKNDDLKVNQKINIITYYIDYSINDLYENPLCSIISFDGNCEIVHHYYDIEVYNDIYNVLNRNNLIERII